MPTPDYTVYGYFAFFMSLAHQQIIQPHKAACRADVQCRSQICADSCVIFTRWRRASNGNNYMAQTTISGPLTDSLSFAPRTVPYAL